MNILAGLDLAETGGGTGKVDVLLGSDFYWDIFSGAVKRGDSGPIALQSKFGWVLSGKFENGKVINPSIVSPRLIQVLRVDTSDNLNESVICFGI